MLPLLKLPFLKLSFCLFGIVRNFCLILLRTLTFLSQTGFVGLVAYPTSLNEPCCTALTQKFLLLQATPHHGLQPNCHSLAFDSTKPRPRSLNCCCCMLPFLMQPLLNLSFSFFSILRHLWHTLTFLSDPAKAISLKLPFVSLLVSLVRSDGLSDRLNGLNGLKLKWFNFFLQFRNCLDCLDCLDWLDRLDCLNPWGATFLRRTKAPKAPKA